MPFTFGGDFISDDEIKRQDKAKKPVRISKERRKNSMVTLVHNLPLDEIEMKELLKKIKAQLGTGGSIKDEVLQIQGDHVAKVNSALKKLRPDLTVAG